MTAKILNMESILNFMAEIIAFLIFGIVIFFLVAFIIHIIGDPTLSAIEWIGKRIGWIKKES